MNNMDKVKTTHILGVITLAELIITKGMFFSVIIWICYGIYKYYND